MERRCVDGGFGSGRLASWCIALTVLLVSPGAFGQTIKTFKHDQFSENIYEAVNELNSLGAASQNEPGFVAGEAFGALFRPNLQDYPIKILGVDVIFGGPMAFPDLNTSLDIEIYLDAGAGPAPTNATPDFTIGTTDFWNANTNEFGIPVKGNTAYQWDFDYMEEGGAPPLVTQGNIMVLFRFKEIAKNYSVEWNNFLCSKEVDFGLCGCQPISMILDQAPTQQTNIMHVSLSSCSGSKEWKYFEQVTDGLKKLNGDVIIRIRAESSDPGCQGDCNGKQCGDDGCGNPCGFCDDGDLCSNGTCLSCDCAGKQCGDDGCGNSCGTCGAGQVCSAGSCTSSCSCDGKVCGDDGCGTSCGTCAAGQLCQAGACIANCSCDGKVCGDDGCGTSCGSCSDDETCQAGACVPASTCVPDCADKACGDDGCGGTCGECTDGTCKDGKCEPTVAPADLAVTRIDPAFGYADEQTQVSILGAGFAGNMSVRLGGTELIVVQVETASLLSATVPKGLEVGTYTLIATRDGEATAFLDDAYEVRAREASSTCGDSTCDESESCSTCPADCGQCPDTGPGPDVGGATGAATSGCTSAPTNTLPAGFLLLFGLVVFAWSWRRAQG